MPSTGFLTLPIEIRHAIYKMVFPGARLSIHVTTDDNENSTIKKTKFAPCVVNASFLKTCSTINIEAFPIMAGSIDLAIFFETEHWMRFVNLSTLPTLSCAPSPLSRIFPHIKKLTFCHHPWNGCCSGLAGFSNLQRLCIQITVPLCEDYLPHLDEQVLCNTNEAAAILASAARDKIMFEEDWTELRGLVESREREFKIYLQAETDFEFHAMMCTAAQDMCLCRREEECPGPGSIALVSSRQLRFQHAG